MKSQTVYETTGHIADFTFIHVGAGCKQSLPNLLPEHNKYICRSGPIFPYQIMKSHTSPMSQLRAISQPHSTVLAGLVLSPRLMWGRLQLATSCGSLGRPTSTFQAHKDRRDQLAERRTKVWITSLVVGVFGKHPIWFLIHEGHFTSNSISSHLYLGVFYGPTLPFVSGLYCLLYCKGLLITQRVQIY